MGKWWEVSALGVSARTLTSEVRALVPFQVLPVRKARILEESTPLGIPGS